jgi:hypothetical protein
MGTWTALLKCGRYVTTFSKSALRSEFRSKSVTSRFWRDLVLTTWVPRSVRSSAAQEVAWERHQIDATDWSFSCVPEEPVVVPVVVVSVVETTRT